jgi:hypothetical protein
MLSSFGLLPEIYSTISSFRDRLDPPNDYLMSSRIDSLICPPDPEIDSLTDSLMDSLMTLDSVAAIDSLIADSYPTESFSNYSLPY